MNEIIRQLMLKIGLIGGMSEHSSQEYQRILTEMIQKKYGPDHSPWWTVEARDFAQIMAHMKKEEWDIIQKYILGMLNNLLKTECKVIALCTNTMHRFAPEMIKMIESYYVHCVGPMEVKNGEFKEIPRVLPKFIDIREAVSSQIQKDKFTEVGLIGTIPTMTSGLYEEILNPLGITIKVPSQTDQQFINEVIFERLAQGKFNKFDRTAFKHIMDNLDCPAVIMGCTEIPKLMQMESFERKHDRLPIKLYDTTFLHCQRILEEISK